MIRIIVVDEHEVVRVGLKSILDATLGLRVIGEASTAGEMMMQVRAGGVDVLIMELLTPGRGGVDLIHQIRKEFPQLPVLVLTAHKEIDYANRAIKAGASGYLTKESTACRIVEAVRRLAAGRRYISEELAEHLAMQLADLPVPSGHKCLTIRELDIFLRIARGESCTSIAGALTLSVKTISTHKARIMDKMRFSSVSDLVQYAVAHKLVAEYVKHVA
jgi:DNA-binding NarL/FixJ family response regulator